MRIKGFKDAAREDRQATLALHAGYSAAFLIDQYRQLVSSGKGAQVIGQRAQLTSLLYIAAKQDKAKWLTFSEKVSLVS